MGVTIGISGGGSGGSTVTFVDNADGTFTITIDGTPSTYDSDQFEKFANLAAFPVTGDADVIYLAEDTDTLYAWDGAAYGVVGGSAGTFAADTPVVLDGGRTLGPYSNGDTIPTLGLTAEQAYNLLAQEFLTPQFSSFNLVQTSPIEVGTTISGVNTFNWATSNSGNVTANSLIVRDVTNATDLATGLANDGTEDIAIGTIQKNSEDSHQWRIELQDTDGGSDTATDSVLWRYLYFYGATAADPTNDTEARALGNERFTNTSNTFTFATGDTLNKFAIVLPPGKTISSIIDESALNADITASYVNQGNITIVDAGANNVTYTLYVMTIAVPYGDGSHNHQINLAG